MFPLIFVVTLLAGYISTLLTVNDCFGSGKPLNWVWLPPKAVWAGDNSLKVFSDENNMFCCTALPYTCVWGQSSCSGQRQRCFSFGTGCAGPGCRETETCAMSPLPSRAAWGRKGEHLGQNWDAEEAPVLRQQGVLGKTRWTEPASTKWPQRRRAESVMWQLKKGQWQFLWSSLFLLSTGINLRQSFRLGRKKSVLSKKKKTVDLPLPSGERLYFRALDICWFYGVFLIPLPMRKGLWVFWGSKLLKLLPEDLIYSCKVRAAHGSPVPYSLGHEGGERKSSCSKHQCCFYPLLYLLLLHRSLTH